MKKSIYFRDFSSNVEGQRNWNLQKEDPKKAVYGITVLNI